MFSGVVATLWGVGSLVASYRAWTGRWRSWVGTRQEPYPITLYPAMGAGALMGGLGTLGVLSSDSPIAVVLFVVLMVGLVLSFVTPKWWGPRWYRERERTADPSLRGFFKALRYAVALMRSRSSQPVHPYPPEEMIGPVLTRWTGSWINADESAPAEHGPVHAGAVRGELYLHEGGVSFISNRSEDLVRGIGTGIAFSTDEVHGVRVVPCGAGPDGQPREAGGARSLSPRLVLDTKTGPRLFEVASAERTAARISEALSVGTTPS
jgi:hypothetical protein